MIRTLISEKIIHQCTQAKIVGKLCRFELRSKLLPYTCLFEISKERTRATVSERLMHGSKCCDDAVIKFRWNRNSLETSKHSFIILSVTQIKNVEIWMDFHQVKCAQISRFFPLVEQKILALRNSCEVDMIFICKCNQSCIAFNFLCSKSGSPRASVAHIVTLFSCLWMNNELFSISLGFILIFFLFSNCSRHVHVYVGSEMTTLAFHPALI